MIEQICLLLEQSAQAKEWFYLLKVAKPRYIRDQLLIVKGAVESSTAAIADKALQYCINNKINSAADFKSIIAYYKQEEQKAQSEEPGAKIIQLNPLNGTTSQNAFRQPEKSALADYESILKKK